MRSWAAVLVGVAAMACKGDPAGPASNEIVIENSVFSPTTKTVGMGAVVTWTNQDAVQHNIISTTVPSGAASFNGSAAGSGSFQATVNSAGTYQYYCSIHGTPTTGMRGSISVVAN